VPGEGHGILLAGQAEDGLAEGDPSHEEGAEQNEETPSGHTGKISRYQDRLFEVARVFVLEDEKLLREQLVDFLEELGHRVTAAASVAEYRAAWSARAFDIAIVDRGLPDGDGLDVVVEMTAGGEALGIIVLTGQGEMADRLSGLGRGADHYLVKPVRMDLLAATVDALVRRLRGGSGAERWALDTVGWKLLPPGREAVQLAPHDFTILQTLMQARGRVVPRRELILALGGDPSAFDQRKLDKDLSRLRQKVESEVGIELPVHTIRRSGYVFTAESVFTA